MLEMTIPSSLDKTIAPPGCHVCLIFSQFTPYHLRGGKTWDQQTKQAYAKQVKKCDTLTTKLKIISQGFQQH